MTHRILALTSLAGALAAFTACTELPIGPASCTDMYAPDAVDIVIDAEDGAWDDGFWVFEAAGLSCAIELPGTDADCERDILIHFDGNEPRSLSLWEQAPDDVEVVLTHDGVERLRKTISPTYEVEEPNGPGCGERSYAVEAVELSAQP